MATFTPPLTAAVNVKKSVKGASSLGSTPLKACSNLTVVNAASVRANCCPIHIRGPPLNGRYCQLFYMISIGSYDVLHSR